MKASVAIFLLLLFSMSVVRGQPQRFDTENGLSNRDVTSILQAQNGAMWFGTSDGLNFFDGYAFMRYEWDGMTGTKIKCIYEDRSGLLWLGTWDGLTIVDPKTGKSIHHFRESASRRKVSNNRVNCIAGRENGDVLVTYGDGILCLFRGTGPSKVVYRATDPGGSRRRQITAIEPGKNATWIVLDYQTVVKLDSLFVPDRSFTCNVESVVRVHFNAADSSLYLPDRWGLLFRASAATGATLQSATFDSVNVYHKKITAMAVTPGAIWLGYDDGALVQLDRKSGYITDHTAMISPHFSGPPRVIFADRSGTMWIGGNYGLLRFAPPALLFRQVLSDPRSENPSAMTSVRGMCQDVNGDIYIGGYGGLFRLDAATGTVKHVTVNVAGQTINSAYYPYRLYDDGDHIWMTSEVRGFYRFNKRHHTIEFPPESTEKDRIHSCYALLAQGPDTLWLGTGSGLFVYSRKRNTLKRFGGTADRFDVSDLEITDLAMTSSGSLWIGTRSEGIFLLDRKKGICSHISATRSGGSMKSVTCLHNVKDSLLWVGTRGEGLHLLDQATFDSRRFTEGNGLADNSVASVVTDNSGGTWIATFNGLSRYNTQSETFENFTERDGLSDNEFNIAAHLVASDGTVYLGGLNGINVFDPLKLRKPAATPPRIYLTRFVRFNGDSDRLVERTGDLRHISQLVLGHRDKFFGFSFALDDYLNPAGNNFRYMLAGADTAWQPLGNQNNVRFERLGAGTYTLFISGMNSEGIRSGNQLVFPIRVSQPFYKTWWFAWLVLLATGFSVYLATRYLMYQRFRIMRLRTRLSSDLHDEVGSMLTRISVQAELMKKGLPAIQTAESAQRIALASRQATEAMSDILWSIDARNDKMSSMLDKLREHADEMLGPMGLDAEFTVEGIPADASLGNAERQDMLLIFKEAVSNVARHSGATRLSVKIARKKDVFIMQITDNGCGYDGSRAGTGQGLRNMKMRAERLGGELFFENNGGFQVTFRSRRTVG